MSRRSLDLTLEILTTINRTGSPQDILASVVPRLEGFGVRTVIASLIPAPGTTAGKQKSHLVVENTPPEWKRRYFSQNYMFSDPIVRETFARQSGFRWSDLEPPDEPDPKARRVMGEAGEFGLRDGFTVPLVTLEGGQGGVTFAGSTLEIAPEHGSLLTLLASYVFARALILRGLEESGTVQLAAREREALQWSAEGKSDWEIGELMGISEHGADYLLRAARTKLGVRTRTHAVAEGLRRRLIV